MFAAWRRTTNLRKLRGAKIRLVTWNCCRGDYLKKRDAISELAPDLAIVQEAKKGNLAEFPDLWHGPALNNGLAVITGPGVDAKIAPLDESVLWSIIPLKISGIMKFHLLGVWTRQEQGYMNSLKRALNTYRNFITAAPTVVMGDFNCSVKWDNSSAGFSPLAELLETDFGLKSAYHSFFGEKYGEESKPTLYFRWNVSDPFHIDYCFVPASWNVTSVDVGSYEKWSSLSDHRPLITEVEF